MKLSPAFLAYKLSSAFSVLAPENLPLSGTLELPVLYQTGSAATAHRVFLCTEEQIGSLSSLPEESSELEPEPTVLPIRAVAVPKESMTSPDAVSAFLDTVDKERYNCVAVELKDKTGVLYYQSAVELATTCKAM